MGILKYKASGSQPQHKVYPYLLRGVEVDMSKYIAFYNGERPHQGLKYQTSYAMYISGVGGGAVIVDKYPAVQGFPIPLRCTRTALQAGHIENVADTEDQNPGQRRPAVCEIRANLN